MQIGLKPGVTKVVEGEVVVPCIHTPSFAEDQSMMMTNRCPDPDCDLRELVIRWGVVSRVSTLVHALSEGVFMHTTCLTCMFCLLSW